MDGEWEYKKIGPSKINITKLFGLIKNRKLEPICLNINDIAYKSLDSIDVHGVRYKVADENFPLIVVQDMENPHNKKYRMIDGRHRLKKQLNSGNTELLFYVLKESDVLPYIEKL